MAGHYIHYNFCGRRICTDQEQKQSSNKIEIRFIAKKRHFGNFSGSSSDREFFITTRINNTSEVRIFQEWWLATLAVENLKKLSDFYANADSNVKRGIVGSIYLEKWVFDGEAHRTPEISEVAKLIFHINIRLRHKKTGVKTSEIFTPVKYPGRDSNPWPSV